jgi:hypothetical protein
VHLLHVQESHSTLRCTVDTKTGHGDGLARATPFGRSGRLVFAAIEGKRRGELGDSHHGLHMAVQGLSWSGGDEQQ